ncbi:unnamed protein product [Caenorhabditis auriculariae]|uniref:Autophagy-related protein 101 n=1 Tax=Caenorhabditis auriculariae TaxID=2777116 RepID=A0A8S1HEQ2_9PELO|nr:unnamed protein product [Caenorhabditis auriculariae]
MNARQHELRLTVELRQVNDAVSCIFHSLLLHRTLAKFQFSTENNYTLGSLGLKEVDCDHIDLTYVRVNSEELAMRLDEDVRQFRSECCSVAERPNRPRFLFQKQRRQSFGGWISGAATEDSAIWEQWKLILDVFRVDSNDELRRMRHTVADSLGDLVLSICTKINQPLYIPKMPSKSLVNDVFETRFSDCQPFLFQIKRQAVPTLPQKPSFTQAAFQRIWKDVLS